jgi:hypothetical protein
LKNSSQKILSSRGLRSRLGAGQSALYLRNRFEAGFAETFELRASRCQCFDKRLNSLISAEQLPRKHRQVIIRVGVYAIKNAIRQYLRFLSFGHRISFLPYGFGALASLSSLS